MNLNKKALYACNGQVQAAIDYLTNPPKEPEPQQPPPPKTHYVFPKISYEKQQKVLQVAQLGFTDEGKIRNALELSKWDTETAVSKLLDDNGSLKSDFSAYTPTPVANTSNSSSFQPSSMIQQNTNLTSHNPAFQNQPVPNSARSTGFSYTAQGMGGYPNNSTLQSNSPPNNFGTYDSSAASQGFASLSSNAFANPGGFSPQITGNHNSTRVNANQSRIQVYSYLIRTENPFADHQVSKKYSAIDEFDPFSDSNRI